MTVSPTVRIAGLGLWLPGHPSVTAWIGGVPDALAVKPPGLGLDKINRRRASSLARSLADVCTEALADSRLDRATTQTVIGSSIAEAATLLGLLEQIWHVKEPVSPAAFTMSVHNAASGLISISSGNRGFTTSLAADEDTPAAALLEAIGLVHSTGRPVGVVCGDEASPPKLLPDDLSWGPLAAGVVLAPAQHDGPCRARLRILRPGAASLPPACVEARIGRNPQAGMLDLVDAVARGLSGILRLDRGLGLGWCAHIEAGAPA